METSDIMVVLLPSYSNETEKNISLSKIREAFSDIEEKQIIFLCDVWGNDTDPRPENVVKYADILKLDIFQNTDKKRHCYLDITNVQNRSISMTAMWITIANLQTLHYKISIFEYWGDENKKILIRLEI